MKASRRILLTGVALSLSPLFAVACTTDDKSPASPSSSATEGATPTKPPQGQNEVEQGERAKAAAETVSVDDPLFVEGGLERVVEGAHSRSPLEKGKSYSLSVACVGQGSVKLVVADKDQQSVPCDGVRVTRRIERAPAVLPIEITAESGATGMVAWEITSVAD